MCRVWLRTTAKDSWWAHFWIARFGGSPMKSSRRKPKTADNSVTPHLRSALYLLLQAWDQASRSQRDVWACAVKRVDLRAAGLTETELRSLVTIGFVQHAVEKTRAGAKRRV